MKRWIGRSIIAIGLLHTVFGLITFRHILAVLSREGMINTVNGQPERLSHGWPGRAFGGLSADCSWVWSFRFSRGRSPSCRLRR